MAVRAGQLALAHRVGIGLEEVALGVDVAGEALLVLGFLGKHRVGRRVDGVAVRAGEVVHVVGAAGPGLADVPRMTGQAHAVLGLDGCLVLLFGAELDHRRARRASLYPAGVGAARTVTGLALVLPLPERGARIVGIAVLRLENAEQGWNP